MIELSTLPAVNATLNAVSAILLLTGYAFIRRGQIAEHRAMMMAAFATSGLFLISYVVYHANAGSRAYTGQGVMRIVYFVILVSHVLLAAVILPLSLLTLTRGLRGHYGAHRQIARWTLPIWLYVSVTGVLVYVVLYQL
ncbi:MAG: DUF420 domain-containing protein [Acidobacteria bacterium]|nr:DUF420 domain-containing protein [Acidobacteriota bacterium]